MRPPTPSLNLSTYLANYIRDPSASPTHQESPIDTLAQYLSAPVEFESSLTAEEPELTPTMQYASLPTTYSPLLQHQREQQLHALQQQQCIPGLAQIYMPTTTPSTTFNPAALAASSLVAPVSRSSSAAYEYDEADPDSDYLPSGGVLTSSTRKRSSSPSPSQKASSSRTSNEGTPAPKRQRAAPSGPISTKDWVPPDVTGLNKREARLVKNRAAAFLSRQRKREEFELMEVCVSLLFHSRRRRECEYPFYFWRFRLFELHCPRVTRFANSTSRFPSIWVNIRMFVCPSPYFPTIHPILWLPSLPFSHDPRSLPRLSFFPSNARKIAVYRNSKRRMLASDNAPLPLNPHLPPHNHKHKYNPRSPLPHPQITNTHSSSNN